MASFTLVSPQTIIARNAGALYGTVVGATNTANYAALAGTNTDGFLNSVYANSVGTTSTADVATVLITNLGITDAAAVATAQNYIVAQLNAVAYTARGAVVNSILNLFAGLTNDATFGTYATAWNNQIANVEAYDQVPGSAQTDWSEFITTVNDNTYTLTNGTDNVPASKGVVTFVADQVYNPAGTARINSLQDEDNLTGTGTSTLNATLGNTGDNGGNVITPKLAGISTVNAAFTGSGAAPNSTNAVFALDLQDATGVSTVNVSRVSGTANQASVENIQAPLTDMGIINSNSNSTGGVEFSFAAGVLKGLQDAPVNLTLSNVQLGNVNIGQNNLAAGVNGLPGIGGGGLAVITNGYENLVISSDGKANTIGNLNLPMDTDSKGSVTIKGSTDLRLATSTSVVSPTNANNSEVTVFAGGINQAQGRLATIDASALTGSLELAIGSALLSTGKADTSGQNQDVTVTGTANNDIFYLNDIVQAGDKIDGGAGTDKIVVYTQGNVGAISGVEKVDVEINGNNTNTITLNFDNIKDATRIDVRNITHNAAVPAAVVGGVAVPAVPATSADNGADQVVNLNNLTAAQAANLNISHSTTFNNDIVDTTLNAVLKTDTTDDKVVLAINENVNTDPRFNFTLKANAIDANTKLATAAVENITIFDGDTESNSVALTNIGQHTGTITVGVATGTANLGNEANPASIGTGRAGTFINFDTAVHNGGANDQRGGYNIDANGGEGDFGSTIAPANVDSAVNTAANLTANARYNTLDNGVAADARIIAQTFDASAENSDVIARFGDVTRANGVSSQSVTGGAGNDTFIFDAQGVKNSGYTSGDSVNGGAGLDTLVIDGNTTAAQANGTAGVGGNISVQKSEWDNTKGIDVLRLAGNQGYVNGTSNGIGKTAAQDITLNTTKLTGIIGSSDKNGGYYIEIDNDFVKQVGDGTTLNGNNLKIISNDGDLSTNQESDLVLNLRPLAQTSNVTFVGANGNAAVDAAGRLNASNRVQLEDNSANGSNALDGGDTVVDASEGGVAGTTRLSSGNNNVLEVFNSADVSINDLAQTKNFGRIEGTNDLAIAQSLKLVLNDTVVDQLVDAGTAARVAAPGITANIERLTVVANNNANIAGAVENLNIDASAVSAKFGLDVFVARNAVNNITGSLGNDKVLILGNYNANDAAAGGYAGVANDQFSGANVLTGAKIAALTNPTSSNTLLNQNDVRGNNAGTYWGADNIAGTADDILLKDTSIYNLGAGDTIEVFGGVDLTGATIAAGTNLIAHSTVRLTDAQVNSLASIKFVGASNHLLEIADDGNATTTAHLLNTGLNTNKLTVDAAGGVANLFVATTAATSVDGLSTFTKTGGTVNTTTTVGGVAQSNFTQGAVFNDTNVAGTNGAPVAVGSDSTGVVTTPTGTTPLTIGFSGTVTATAAADAFSFNVAAAKASAPNTQIVINSFATAADSLVIDTATALGNVKLSALNGVDGISVQSNPITNSTLVNFGADANGDVITITLAGVVDASLVNVSVI